MSELRIEHVALWARDLERLREFYVSLLGGRSGPPYVNPRTGFRSYFISFGDGGARVELMSRPGVQMAGGGTGERPGYAHVAFASGSREAVDTLVTRLEAQGVEVLGRPRLTGDGYYEAVLADPEGNRIELVGPPGEHVKDRDSSQTHRVPDQADRLLCGSPEGEWAHLSEFPTKPVGS